MNTTSARLITVEGGEGAGKSTCLDFVREYLEATGKQVVVTREPGGTPLGEEIRSILLEPRVDGMEVDAELLLVFAARAEHIGRVIRPALERGAWVVCDRFTDATYAYQGGGRGVATERIAELEEWVQQGLHPDLTILLDLPVEAGLERARQRSTPDRFEREQQAFFRRVRATYRQRAKGHAARFRTVDASRNIGEVEEQLRKILGDYLK